MDLRQKILNYSYSCLNVQLTVLFCICFSSSSALQQKSFIFCQQIASWTAYYCYDQNFVSIFQKDLVMSVRHDAKYGANLGTMQHIHDGYKTVCSWRHILLQVPNLFRKLGSCPFNVRQSHIQQGDDSLLPVVLVASFLQ